MSDADNQASKNYSKRLQQEYAEANELRARYQKQLDLWWQSQRDLEFEEDDIYEVGGFLERWSQTPSYTKGRRDRDWRIR
jgi:hypothetical protein